jgi:hypothetical protein
MKMTSLIKFSLTFLSLIIFASVALAVESFTVPIPKLRVYSQPSTLSQVIATLSQGQTVQAGSNPGGGFKKVLVTDNTGKKRIGYVSLSEISGRGRSGTSSRRRSYGGSGEGLHNHYAIGITGGIAYDMGARVITDSTNTSYTTSSMTGVSPEFGAFLLWPFSPKFNVDIYLDYKPTAVTGTYTPTGFPTSLAVAFNQSFVSVGGLGHLYLHDNGSWWFGPGVQLDWGLSATATINSIGYTLSTNQYVLLYGATGYDIQLTDSMYITPLISFGADVNASPIIMEGNFIVNLSFKL